MKKISESLQLTGEELENFLNDIIENNKYLQEQGKFPISVEIQGQAGLGKTSIVQQVAEKNKKPFVKLNLAQIEEIGDLVGLPIKEIEVCKKDEKTKENIDCIFVIESTINEYLNLGYSCTGKTRMGYAPPEWIQGKTEGGILLIDDWTRGDIRYIQACMELISRQEYISWKLPKGWTVILTSNPSDGEYMVNEIDNAHRTRFISVNLKWDVNSWVKYAESVGIDGRCINFMLLNSDIVTNEKKNEIVNPRTIEMFFNIISNVEDFSTIEGLGKINTYGTATVGSSFSTMFIQFINNKLDKLPTPEFIFKEKNFKEVKSVLESVINPDKDVYRSDIASVLGTRICNFSIEYAKNNSIKDDYLERLEDLFVNEKIFQVDISYNSIKKIFNGHSKFKSMMLSKKLNDVIKK